jgi:hypothetical protein
MKSYKFRILQVIKVDNNDNCSTFCDKMMVKISDKDNYFSEIVFSDEITFRLSGTINQQVWGFGAYKTLTNQLTMPRTVQRWTCSVRYLWTSFIGPTSSWNGP